MSEYIAKAPIEPRDYRVVFLIQKKPEINQALFPRAFRLALYLERIYFPAEDSSLVFQAAVFFVLAFSNEQDSFLLLRLQQK